MKHTAVTIALFLSWLTIGGRGQVVEVGTDGKTDAPRATPEYCSQVEPIRANFKVIADASVRGHLTDQSTAPLRNSPIELRRFISRAKQITVRRVSTDGDGKFDLGVVKKGDYRLLLSHTEDSNNPRSWNAGRKSALWIRF